MTKFYITTSIPYANAAPHIGFALEIVQADVIARYRKAKGGQVFFLTGTDEHGTKIAKAAADTGISPKAFVDSISVKFQALAKALNISNDDFIRTTDQERHWPSVKVAWGKLRDNGDIYKKQYEGLYCSGCEAFVKEKELFDGLCPIHKRKPELVQEENYFFKLSKYGKQVEDALKNNTLRIIPEARKSEFLEFIKQGLEDVSFSRSREKLSWGIPVPEDDSQTIYVWSDALVNYLSALGYPSGGLFKKFWPADVHIVGKDIAKFHVLYWPAMLLSLGLPLPKTVFVHGFITVGGQKMSKSIGNVIDPFLLVEKYGADALRYFVLRELPPTEDGDFTQEKFDERYNADLASGLGNLVARVLAMAQKTMPNGKAQIPNEFQNPKFKVLLEETKNRVSDALDEFQFSLALEKIWEVIKFCDRYIDEKKPWSFTSVQDQESKKEVIDDLLLAISDVANLLTPFLPETSEKIKVQLSGGERTPLFPRLLSN